MIARLWWKEFRQFWPIWLTVAFAAMVGQWMMLRYFGGDVRNGALAPAALSWACLYAFAVGAAAFAGEREAKTLLLLDTMPVDRVVLWGGKASFALVSTVALAAFLFVVSTTATDHYNDQYSLPTVLLGGGVLIVEAVGWGLFWSSLSKTSLGAASLAVISMALALPLTAATAWAGDVWFSHALWTRAVIVAITVGASAAIIAAPRRPIGGWGRRGVRVEVPAPVVVQTRPGRAATATVSGWESWTTTIWRLTWETVRSGGATWGLYLFLGLILPVILAIIFHGELGLAFAGWVNVIIAISAGVTIFGAENRGRTTRFLAHHGVRPGAVWVTKLAIWGLGLAVIWMPYAVVFRQSFLASTSSPGQTDTTGILYAAGILNCVAVGQLCGMAIRRGITAWIIAVIATMIVMVPQTALFTAGMLPTGWLLATPLALLAVSWGWCGEWLLERPGAGRWVRLSLLLVGAFGLVGSSYASHRVLSVPEFGPALDRQYLQLDSTTVPDSSNAADVYREAARMLQELSRIGPASGEMAVARVIGEGWDAKAEPVVQWLESSREALALIRRGAAMPSCQFARPDSLTLFTPLELPPLGQFGQLLALDAREKQSRGDLAGAWNSVMAMLHMARQIDRQATMIQSSHSIAIESQALELAMAWSTDPRQTAERIKAALAEYEALSAPRPFDETIRVEALLADRTLALPVAELREHVLGSSPEREASDVFWTKLWRDVQTTPWELARARRVSRLLFASAVLQARQEPWQRSSYQAGMIGLPDLGVEDGSSAHHVSSTELNSLFQSAPLVKEFLPATESRLAAADRAEVGRRALVQVLAIRLWQLTHGGQVSEDLKTMVTAASPTFPRDPYTNESFRWIRSEGQVLLPLGESLRWQPGNLDKNALRSTSGCWLLYSVGPDRRDDEAKVNYGERGVNGGDIIFPIPAPAGSDAGAKPNADKPPDVKP